MVFNAVMVRVLRKEKGVGRGIGLDRAQITDMKPRNYPKILHKTIRPSCLNRLISFINIFILNVSVLQYKKS